MNRDRLWVAFAIGGFFSYVSLHAGLIFGFGIGNQLMLSCATTAAIASAYHLREDTKATRRRQRDELRDYIRGVMVRPLRDILNDSEALKVIATDDMAYAELKKRIK